MTTPLPDLRPPFARDSEAQRVDVGEGHALVMPPDDKTVTPGVPWWEHPCVAGDGTAILTAASLHPDHVVTGEWPTVTIRPSLLCRSCGSHGWLTDSRWRSC